MSRQAQCTTTWGIHLATFLSFRILSATVTKQQAGDTLAAGKSDHSV